MDEECRYKLYVSPQPEYLPATFERTLEVLTDTAAQAFKVGADCYGFLRPDKLVIYFSSRNDALTAATLLQSTLAGIAAHGVPFTAEISTDGLISWGVDPPTGTRLLPWEGSSWRRWLTDRLAAALIAARDAAVALPAWQFALDRIAIEGVDPQTWLPEAICG